LYFIQFSIRHNQLFTLQLVVLESLSNWHSSLFFVILRNQLIFTTSQRLANSICENIDHTINMSLTMLRQPRVFAQLQRMAQRHCTCRCLHTLQRLAMTSSIDRVSNISTRTSSLFETKQSLRQFSTKDVTVSTIDSAAVSTSQDTTRTTSMTTTRSKDNSSILARTHTASERQSSLLAAQHELEKHNPYKFKVALFGSPNCGKSTIFNRLQMTQKRINKSNKIKYQNKFQTQLRSAMHSSGAITDAAPGVTRDRRDARAKLLDLEFDIIDTAGLEVITSIQNYNEDQHQSHHVKHKVKKNQRAFEKSSSGALARHRKADAHFIENQPMRRELQKSVLKQTTQALYECDVALFVIDARQGITDSDRYWAHWLKSQVALIRKQGKRIPPRIHVIANNLDYRTVRL
jgi:GTPase SAR1 family protein